MADIKSTKTIVYKQVGKLDISFDIYIPRAAKNVPILLWFHGKHKIEWKRQIREDVR